MPRIAALARLDPDALASPGEDPLELREEPFLTRFLVRCRPALFGAILAAADLGPAETVGAVARAGTRRALRLGPDRLVLLDAPETGAALEAAVAAVVVELGGAFVDLREGQTTLRLDGPDAAVRATLAEGCPLDLHPHRFAPGRVAASLFGKVPVQLEPLALGAGRLSVALHVDRSLAEHLARHLALAGREFGFRLRR